MISDNTIERVLGDNTSLANKGEVLISLAMQGEIVQPGGQDNCTLELIQIDGSPFKTSYFHSENPIGRPQGGQGGKGSRKKTSIILAAVAAVVLATIVGLTALFIINSKKDKEKEQLQARFNQLELYINKHKKSNENNHRQIINFGSTKKQLQQQIDDINNNKIKINNAEVKQAKLELLNRKIDTCDRKIDTLKARIDKYKDSITKRDEIKEELKKYNINTGEEDNKEVEPKTNTSHSITETFNPATSPVIASGTPTTGDASLSEEEKLDKDFEELCRQMNTTHSKPWRDNVFKAWLKGNTTRTIPTLKNLYYKKDTAGKKDIVDNIKKEKLAFEKSKKRNGRN